MARLVGLVTGTSCGGGPPVTDKRPIRTLNSRILERLAIVLRLSRQGLGSGPSPGRQKIHWSGPGPDIGQVLGYRSSSWYSEKMSLALVPAGPCGANAKVSLPTVDPSTRLSISYGLRRAKYVEQFICSVGQSRLIKAPRTQPVLKHDPSIVAPPGLSSLRRNQWACSPEWLRYRG